MGSKGEREKETQQFFIAGDVSSAGRYRKLAKNTLIFALGTLGSRSIAFFMLPLYTRLLTQKDYGILDIFQTTVSLLVPVLSLEIVEAVFRFSMDEAKEGAKRIISTALLFTFLLLLASFGLIPIFARLEIFQMYLPYFYAIWFLTVLLGGVKQYVRALGQVKIFAWSDILYVLVFAGFNVIFMVLFHMGLRGYLLSYVLAQIVSFFFVASAGRVFSRLSLRSFDRRLLRDMLAYSLPLIPNALMWWVMNVSDRYLILHFLGLEANGLYAVACRFPVLLSVVTGVFFPAWQISAVEEFNAKDRNQYYAEIFALCSSALFILTGAVLLFLPEVTGLFVAPNFHEAWKYVPFLLFGTIFHAFASFLGTVYLASKDTIGALFTTTLGGLTNFLLNLIFIHWWGVQGAAFTTMIGFLVIWGARVADTKKICPVCFNALRLYFALCLLGIEALVLFWHVPTVIRFFISFGVFFALIALERQNVVRVFSSVNQLTFVGKKVAKSIGRKGVI
ncbi:MAG: oligosaccharide flippase family protein [Candidatus Atribacteria bacterium]|nr:oligosaccharide flippase family protein [Candidatus Atribacteria bacterium]